MLSINFSNVAAKLFPAIGRRDSKLNSQFRQEHFAEIISPPHIYTPPKSDARTLLKMYSTQPQVRSIVSKVAKSVAKQPWYIENAKGERIDKHPFLDFIRKGNPKLRGRGAIQTTVAQIDLAGEAFWVIGRKGANNTGTPVMFAPVPADWVRNVPEDEDGYYEVHAPNAEPVNIHASDVLWFKEIDPLDPYARGSSITAAASVEISTDESAAQFLKAHFANNATPSMIVSGAKEAPLKDEDRVRLETTWLEKFRGPKKAGKLMFSRSPLEIQEIGKGLRENQTAELRPVLRDIIREVYGVPPEIFGTLENSNRATIDSASYLFAQYTLEPRLALLLDVLEPFFEENFNGAGLTLKYETPVAEDHEFALNVFNARPSAFTDNEARKLAKHKPLPGLDELPPKPEPVDEGDGGTKPGKKKPKKPAPDEDEKAHVSKGLSPEDIVRVSAAVEDPAVLAEMLRIFDDAFRKLLEEYGADLLGELEADANFEISAAVDNWVRTEAPELVAQMNKTTRKDMAASLVEGVAANEAVAALNARIDALFEAAAETRAATIGNTLATKLTGYGSLEAAKQAGFEQKKWLSSVDHLVRSSHAVMNGQVKLLSEKFKSPRGGEALHPGAFGEAAEDVNCRCAMRPVLDGESSKGAKPMSDEVFRAFQTKAFEHMSTKLSTTLKKVFLAQKEVARHEFSVLTRRT